MTRSRPTNLYGVVHTCRRDARCICLRCPRPSEDSLAKERQRNRARQT